jgi:hypothetical protein
MKLIERMKAFHTRHQRRRARIQAYLERRALHPTPKPVPQN